MKMISKARELHRRLTSNENPLAVLKTASDISVHDGMNNSTWLRRTFIAFMREGLPWFVLPAHLRTLPQA